MTVREPELVEAVDELVENRTPLQETGTTFKNRLHQAILSGGEPARKVADVLHGTWLGHPLHPVLTDLTIGAWVLGGIFDGLSLIIRSRRLQKTADDLLGISVVSAVPTALAGMTDYSAIKKEAAGHGLLHAILNSVGLVLNVLSLRARSTNRRGLGLVLSTTALGLLTASAWLGGELVYRLRVGVNHSSTGKKLENWMAVLPDTELPEDHARRVEVEGEKVLLYRHKGLVYAIGAVCSHAGGPLEDGKFYGYCVQCPWHDSVYDLRDGSVVHGPTTYAQPFYEMRVLNGQIEVRAARRQATR